MDDPEKEIAGILQFTSAHVIKTFARLKNIYLDYFDSLKDRRNGLLFY